MNTPKQAWDKRCALHAEADKHYAKGDKLFTEAYKLRAEGDRLRAEADYIFLNAVIATYGNIKMEWKDWCEKGYECHLENGEIYKPE